MAFSKIDICNGALAKLGADPIRSFEDGNKRSRTCEASYNLAKDALLSEYDWSFARRFKKLNQVVDDAIQLPPGLYAFSLPSDCLMVRDLYPKGSRQRWEVVGNYLYCEQDSEVYIYYTSSEIPVSSYSAPFKTLIISYITYDICMSITQDNRKTQLRLQEYMGLRGEMWALDANMASEYRMSDETPENDTFVDPDIS